MTKSEKGNSKISDFFQRVGGSRKTGRTEHCVKLKARCGRSAGTMHGPTVSDHSERKTHSMTVSDYWEMKTKKLASSKRNEGLYKSVASSLGVSSEGNSCIFSNVTVFFTGRTGNMSAMHLGNLLRLHGGEVRPFLALKKVTHIVCENLCASKTKDFEKRLGPGHRIQVVHPNWILESIKKGKKLSEKQFHILKPSSQKSIVDAFKGTC